MLAVNAHAPPGSGNELGSRLRAVIGCVSEAGRGLLGVPTVTSSQTRKQIVQQLLVGDLADLADERLYQLLPGGTENLRAGKNKGVRNKSKHPTYNRTTPKKNQANPSVAKSGLAANALCYVSIEQKVHHQLLQSHAQAQVVQSLRDAVFPELNLRSYMDCKSDLALPTIRHILRARRPTDEMLELDRSLTRALTKQRKSSTAVKPVVPERKNGGLPPNVSKKPHGRGYPHPWLLPMEWED